MTSEKSPKKHEDVEEDVAYYLDVPFTPDIIRQCEQNLIEQHRQQKAERLRQEIELREKVMRRYRQVMNTRRLLELGKIKQDKMRKVPAIRQQTLT